MLNSSTDELRQRISSGRLFHTTGPIAAKLRGPIDVRVLGAERTPVLEDRRCRRFEIIEVSWQSTARYAGASP